MTEDRISDSELNALVDGELDPARQAEIEDWLADNSDAARRVARYRAQNAGLHALYDDILHEELPPDILGAFETRRSGVPAWAAMAAAIALFVVGAAGGWTLRGIDADAGAQVAEAPPIDTQELMVRAAMAHVVSHEDELRSPAPGGSAAIGDYLADRMGKPVRVPSLDSFGYRLVGSRVLPDTDGPAAQFVFADETGKKVSLYVRGEQANGVDITYALADDLSMFYWNDSDRSYAMVTRIDDERGREALLTAAKAVHGQLSQ
ncbi:MAG: anti-sigma factor [Alphaproteobacteria bacterium]|nr:anti-sigma factor [Alphaproteobacteria bacterium]